MTTGVEITGSDKQNLLDRRSRGGKDECHTLFTQGQQMVPAMRAREDGIHIPLSQM